MKFREFVAVVTVGVLASCTSGGSKPGADAGSMAPIEEYDTNMIDCMTAMGWDVTVLDDGGWGPPEGIPTEQRGQFDRDKEECAKEFGYDQPPPPLNEEQALELYDTLQETAGCVRDLGFTVPDPPSERVFVEQLMEKPIPPWHPSDALAPNELDEARAACPVPE